MTYTLWSRGRLLGESPLDFVRCMPKLRVGFLYPSAVGEKLLPVAGGISAASIAFGRALRACPELKTERQWQELPEYADYAAAVDECEALNLELRGPDGAVVPTEDICVRDLEFLEKLADEAMEETFADELEDAELRKEFGEPTLASLGLDDWDASWDPAVDEDDLWGDFDDSLDEPWRGESKPPDWPPYQLQVTLLNDSAIP